jgi:hypothetical protein
VEEEASRRRPNPLHPYQGTEAQKVLRTVLVNIWHRSLDFANVRTRDAGERMLGYIISQQPPAIRRCLVSKEEPPAEQPSSNKAR